MQLKKKIIALKWEFSENEEQHYVSFFLSSYNVFTVGMSTR